MVRLTLGLVALIAIMAGVAFGLPSHVLVKRDIVINAPESEVFPYLNNLHRFSGWSPWAARDPQMRSTYGGPEEGKGALLNWASQRRSVGSGSMEITASNLNRRIDLNVNLNGLEGTSFYLLEPSGSGSKVIWGFGYETGTGPYKRWKGLMLDRFLGIDYRQGLAKLKAKVETERRPVAPPPVVEMPVEATPESAASEQQKDAGASAEAAPAPAEAAPPPKPRPKRSRRRRR
jgi:hypothetical protein